MSTINKIYKFNWLDEDGSICGWNDVVATTKAKARALAKKEGTEAHWSLWSPEENNYIWVDNYVDNGQHCFRMKGLYADLTSLRRQSFKDNCATHAAADRAMW